MHYSTDFVFDGETDRPYTEEDRPNPRGLYAASKLLGDWFAHDARRAYVLRVESLFGEPAPGRGPRGSLATRAMIEGGVPIGLYHCVNAGAASWAQIAEEAARLMGRPLRMKPLTLESAALTAPRPPYCALSSAKLAAAGIVMPPWQDALERHLNP